MVAVSAYIESGLGVELVVLVASVLTHQPLVFAVSFLHDTDVEIALFAYRHGMKLNVGPNVGIPVAGQDDLLGGPVDKIGAFLATNCADMEVAGETLCH